MRTQLLDHGYIELVETWGGDERIIEAARMSTAKGFLGWGGDHEFINEMTGENYCRYAVNWNPNSSTADAILCGRRREDHGPTGPGDEKLLAYLWNNNHATPFEMAGAIVEVQAPIFVFREWHRHRTQSYNELSARYTPLPDVNYIPTAERLMIGAGGSNKQAGTVAHAEMLTEERAQEFRAAIESLYARDQAVYEWALAAGVPKELARVHLPVGRYSRMRASANLRNWLAFLTLRQAPNAQWEIRQYANALAEVLTAHFPRTMALFAGRA